jgi:GNAT superfamily N-acetyltransferase
MKQNKPPSGIVIQRLDSTGVNAVARDLGSVLVDCVEGGASVSFMAGLTLERASAYWRGIAAQMNDGRTVIAARRAADSPVVGVVQMIPVGIENQPHRAEIAKMLVLRAERGRGVGAALMRAAEDAARAAGRTLLTLDTASDAAARLYERLGWSLAGVIPNYALLPDGRPCATRMYYKDLAKAG